MLIRKQMMFLPRRCHMRIVVIRYLIDVTAVTWSNSGRKRSTSGRKQRGSIRNRTVSIVKYPFASHGGVFLLLSLLCLSFLFITIIIIIIILLLLSLLLSLLCLPFFLLNFSSLIYRHQKRILLRSRNIQGSSSRISQVQQRGGGWNKSLLPPPP